MKPEDIFGIVVRFAGLSLFFYGLWYLEFGIATAMGLPEESAGYGVAYFISGAFFLIVGLYLLRGAPGLIGYAYPEKRSDTK